jgi:hypothetical protein
MPVDCQARPLMTEQFKTSASSLSSYPGGQQFGALLRPARFLAEATKRHTGDVRPVLSHPQQGQARFGLTPQRVGPPVVLLGRGPLTPQPGQLAELIGGATGGGTPQQALGGQRLLGRAGPVPAEGQHLGPVHETCSAVRHKVRTGIAPVGERRRPLAGPGHLTQHHAGIDRGTVGQPHDGVRRLLGRDGEHHLVHHRDGAAAVLGHQRSERDRESGQDDDVRVARAEAHRFAAPGRGHRVLHLALHHLPVRHLGQDPAGLGAAQIVLLDQALGARRPGTAAHSLAGIGQDEAARQGAAGGTAPVPRLDPLLIGTPVGTGRLLVLSGQERGVAEHHQLGVVERPQRHGLVQQLEAATPLPGLEQLPQCPSRFLLSLHVTRMPIRRPESPPYAAAITGRLICVGISRISANRPVAPVSAPVLDPSKGLARKLICGSTGAVPRRRRPVQCIIRFADGFAVDAFDAPAQAITAIPQTAFCERYFDGSDAEY